MAHSDKQIELKSTDEIKYKMRRSFSWDRAFYTSDGFLDDDELSSMIEGSGDDDVKHQLQKIEEIESLEAKLLDEIEASAQRSTGTSNVSSSSVNSSYGKKDSQAKKIRAAPARSSPSSSSTPVKTVQTTRGSPSSGASGGSVGSKVKPAARKSTSFKTSKATVDSPSKASTGITEKNKSAPVYTRVPRTSPSSPVSSGSSSSSKFSVNQQSKRGSSVPRRSSASSEKPSAINAKRNNEWEASKLAVRLIPKTQSSISLKVKPPPVISHPSGVSNSCSSSTDQRSKPIGNKGPTVHQRSKSTLKNRPTGQTPDQNRKQPAASRQETRSQSASKTRKHVTPKTVAAVNKGLKQTSQKTTTPKPTTPKPSKKQSSAKARSSSGISREAKNIILVSPEVMDIKGKLNALKMEINMQKKDRCKETKMGHNESGKSGSSSIIQMKNQSKLK